MEHIEHQGRVEALAEDILTDKQLAIDYNRKQQENREAIRRLEEHARNIRPSSRLATSTVNMGDFFIVVPTKKAQDMVGGAQKELEQAIQDVQQRLKKKVQLLNELEGDKHMTAVAKSISLRSTTGSDLYNMTEH
ncbi:hypothetical protein COEREDRAFT_86409 [Coemansia reversa NRRL 1564]|uniref:Prefoldin n=1 Tax=Coemansia reversa (strain ATCC 12441 / NRRL 1564) TaxID=763665 RepID=A0A2G5BDB6_COERN|nr:hypothetical protein COEREDRAFT_86409 [Coemansia reversa NRRL 1564]|eukprot:PIA17001.1 hypothetical protein COEREDRAFT_86409 [Coemansia reversa NRRL 1564]